METKKNSKFKKIFAITYSTALVAFTTYAALDTFVIPRRMTTVSAAGKAQSTASATSDAAYSASYASTETYIAPGVKVSALDIYGTKTPLTAVYAAAGGVCFMLSLLSALHPRRA